MTNQIELSQNQPDTVLQLWQTDLEQLRPVLVVWTDERYPARDADGFRIPKMNQTEITQETDDELIERLTSETIQKLEAAGLEERGKRAFLMHLQLELLWQFLQRFPRNERMQFAALLKRVFEDESGSESQTH